MINRINKKVILFCLVVVFILSMFTVSYASGYKQLLEAWYMNIKIISNGQEIATDKAPFIVNGTTYVPVRMLADIFNKNVAWDGTNYIISITDKPDSTVNTLRTQLYIKDSEIAQLRKRIEELEDEIESEEEDMEQLEEDLNDDYDEFEDIEFEISLSGDEDEITVRIDFDMDDFEDEWEDLSSSDIKSYLQDICDDILDEFDDADIEGYFKDSSGSVKSKMYQFTTSSRGDVVFDDDYDLDIDDLEEDIDDEYWDYFDDIELSIELEGDEDDVVFYIYVDYDEYENEWDDLSDGDIEDLMLDIYYEIEDVFDDASITGYIEDTNTGDTLARYDPDRSEEFVRY